MAANDGGRLALTRFLTLAFASLLAGLDQVGLRQLGAYLLPGTSPGVGLARGILFATLLLGVALGVARRASFQALALLLALDGLLFAASARLWFEAVSHGPSFRLLGHVLPAAFGVCSGGALGTLYSALFAPARRHDVLAAWIRPAHVLLLVLGLLAYTALGSLLGLLRSSALVALVLATLALYVPTLARINGPASIRRAPVYALGLVGWAGALAAYLWARASVPSAALGVYPGDIVWRSARTAELTLVSVQQGLELYGDRELRLTSSDAARYAESLVHPALARAPVREQVLLLGLGSGLVEREILRYPDVRRLTSVAADSSLSRLARGTPTFGAIAPAAPRDPRLSLVEAEPIVWLARTSQRFDAIIVDLPDPSGYLQGKYYTRGFYRIALEHLSPRGLLVTQATSPSSSPGALASIARTVAGAGFAVHVYAAALPLLGEWGFVHGSREPLANPSEPDDVALGVLAATTYLDRSGLDLAWAIAPALAANAEENTLSHQPLVELLAEERRARGF